MQSNHKLFGVRKAYFYWTIREQRFPRAFQKTLEVCLLPMSCSESVDHRFKVALICHHAVREFKSVSLAAQEVKAADLSDFLEINIHLTSSTADDFRTTMVRVSALHSGATCCAKEQRCSCL